MKKLFFLSALGMCLATMSQAYEPFYVGAGVGIGRVSTSIGSTKNKLVGDIHAGYMPMQNIGIEAGAYFFPSDVHGFSSTSAWGISAVGILPLSPSRANYASNYGVLGRVGWASLKSEFGDYSHRSSNFMWGIGIHFGINRQLSARVEYTDFGSTSPRFGHKIRVRRINLLDLNYHF